MMVALQLSGTRTQDKWRSWPSANLQSPLPKGKEAHIGFAQSLWEGAAWLRGGTNGKEETNLAPSP